MVDIPEIPDRTVTKGTEQSDTVPASPYAGIKRQISEDDLQSPAVQRILLGEVDKLETKITSLEEYVEKFHISDKKSAILEEKLKSVKADEVLYGLCLTIGSVIIGLSSMIWTMGYGMIAIAVGTLLFMWWSYFKGDQMALIMTGIGDKGDLENERVGFRVSLDCDLQYFMIFYTSFNIHGFYNRSNFSYWFAPEDVKTGDLVVLCTKEGQDSVQSNENGTKTYFKFWGLKSPLFTDDSKGIVLTKVANWSLSNKIS